MSISPLRNLPSVNELLESPPLRGLVDRISQNVVVSTAGKVLDELRTEVQTFAAEKTLPSVSELAERIARRIAEDEASPLQPVINATGILLHAELGPAPLAKEALEDLANTAGNYSSAGLDAATGRRAQPNLAVESLLRKLTGAEAALVVGSAAGATMLALSALAAGREVIVARGQLVEIGDRYRLPDIFAASTAHLREVGTANSTRLEDYAKAVGDETAAILSVYPSNFTIVGSSAATSLEELVALAGRHKLPVISDLAAAALVRTNQLDFDTEPTVAESIKVGADIVLLRGDGLLGGPQCGIIMGRKSQIEQIERHAMAGALCADKLTLAALAATLRLYSDARQVCYAVPLLRLLATSVDNLKSRAERLAPQMAAAVAVDQAEAIAETTAPGGPSLLRTRLPSWCVALKPAGMSVDALAGALRQGSPSVVGRLQQDRLLLDLRSVLPRQDIQLVSAVEAVGGH